jgi:hypothetical protein
MKKRSVIITVLSCLLVGTIILPLSRGEDRLRTRARVEWKENAIAEIARRAADSNWLASAVKSLSVELAKPDAGSDDWLSEKVILLRNGEWIVFTNKCHKEDQRIHDIFIGRGSDGRWYYSSYHSTYHFCIGMIVPKMDEQPESLAAFAKRYFLAEFDGRSDECLKLTWPPKRK